MHAIIGPNGAGKTTFFNLITGHLTPDKGAVSFEGRDLIGLAAAQDRATGHRPVVPAHQHLSAAERL
jgi:ABC-type branched-subunit amino acid transport system ATPase component